MPKAKMNMAARITGTARITKSITKAITRRASTPSNSSGCVTGS